jgi:hypothetical protein
VAAIPDALLIINVYGVEPAIALKGTPVPLPTAARGGVKKEALILAVSKN